MERLHKYIARCGIASRRRAEELIREGKVTVNHKPVTRMGVLLDPDKDLVHVKGKRVIAKRELCYFLLYKPAGVVSTCDDPQGRKTVLDCLPGKERLFPVGRLDYLTEGLLLLTNDGGLANRLTHPGYAVPKTYLVEAGGFLSGEKIERFRKGIRLEDGMTKPAKVKTVHAGAEASRFFLTITEGRNRQVRRMCEALGLPVIYLCRTRMGFLTLKGLSPGEYRRLEPAEVARLKRSTQEYHSVPTQ
ncbi:MAG: rRNA pseudouridine synthase [Clostridiales bacterium]|nr:rRNA pseudouridine synthase [Clostridiales bacterium]